MKKKKISLSVALSPKKKNEMLFKNSIFKMRGRLSQKYLSSKENMKQSKAKAQLCESFAYSLAAFPGLD